VLADDAPDVAAVRPGLAPEARRIRAKTDGKRGVVERLVAEDVGDRDLGGGIIQKSFPRLKRSSEFGSCRCRRDYPS
jgi:hypothetical protein